MLGWFSTAPLREEPGRTYSKTPSRKRHRASPVKLWTTPCMVMMKPNAMALAPRYHDGFLICLRMILLGMSGAGCQVSASEGCHRCAGRLLKRIYEIKKTARAVLYSTPDRPRSVARPSILAFPMFALSRLETRYRRARRGSIRMSILIREGS